MLIRHGRLIRATLPRSENQPVVRPIPEFTMHQPAGRGGKFRVGAPRGAAARPGQGGRGGYGGGTSRGPAFGHPGSGHGGRTAGRGHQPPRHGKKHSK